MRVRVRARVRVRVRVRIRVSEGGSVGGRSGLGWGCWVRVQGSGFRIQG